MRHRVVALLIKIGLKAILATCRLHVHGLHQIDKARTKGPVILMLWHCDLAPLAEILKQLTSKYPFSAFVSKSRDGQILAHFVLSYKNGQVIQVPHNGRSQALRLLVETLQRKDSPIAIITPDGPRGPPYVLKPGVLFAAKETGSQIIPFNWSATRLIALKTWDRFKIPLPFTTIYAHFGEPIEVSSHTELKDLKAKLPSET